MKQSETGQHAFAAFRINHQNTAKCIQKPNANAQTACKMNKNSTLVESLKSNK